MINQRLKGFIWSKFFRSQIPGSVRIRLDVCFCIIHTIVRASTIPFGICVRVDVEKVKLCRYNGEWKFKPVRVTCMRRPHAFTDSTVRESLYTSFFCLSGGRMLVVVCNVFVRQFDFFAFFFFFFFIFFVIRSHIFNTHINISFLHSVSLIC